MINEETEARDGGYLLLKPVWLGLRALHQVGADLTALSGSEDHRLLCVHVAFTDGESEAQRAQFAC